MQGCDGESRSRQFGFCADTPYFYSANAENAMDAHGQVPYEQARHLIERDPNYACRFYEYLAKVRSCRARTPSPFAGRR
jgi:hypothetical protein